MLRLSQLDPEWSDRQVPGPFVEEKSTLQKLKYENEVFWECRMVDNPNSQRDRTSDDVGKNREEG